MPKKDKHSMAEDYLAQLKWEADHPLDERGRPSAKYQPDWKYKKIYPKESKSSIIMWIFVIAFGALVVGTLLFAMSGGSLGTGIVAASLFLSMAFILFCFSSKPK